MLADDCQGSGDVAQRVIALLSEQPCAEWLSGYCMIADPSSRAFLGHPSASIFDGSCSIGLIPLPVTFRFASFSPDLTQKAEEPPPKITIKERIANMPAAHHGMMLNAPNEIAMPKIRSCTNIGTARSGFIF